MLYVNGGEKRVYDFECSKCGSFKRKYTSLADMGKLAKVTGMAVLRKLIILANSLIRDKKVQRPQWALISV